MDMSQYKILDQPWTQATKKDSSEQAFIGA